jgi:hypothetical protein
MRNVYSVSVGDLKGIDHLEDLDVVRIVLKLTLGNMFGGCGLDSSGTG